MMRGKVGNLIFYEVNGTTRVRSVPLEYRDANTESQRQTRRRLVVAVRFYQHLKETLLWRVWREAARGAAASCPWRPPGWRATSVPTTPNNRPSSVPEAGRRLRRRPASPPKH